MCFHGQAYRNPHHPMNKYGRFQLVLMYAHQSLLTKISILQERRLEDFQGAKSRMSSFCVNYCSDEEIEDMLSHRIELEETMILNKPIPDKVSYLRKYQIELLHKFSIRFYLVFSEDIL